jgi:hypothetical protein
LRRVALVFLALLLLTSTVLSADQEFLSPRELKPGMTGYGKTVFSGSRVDTFQVEIIGVQENVAPKRDMIIARLSGPPLEKTGVISGMSGSPVYVNDKLIGAIAYTWYFLKEPIAGITPIADMVAVLDQPASQGSADSMSNPLPADASGLSVIRTPVAVSGLGRHAMEILQPLLDEIGALPVQGGGSAEAPVEPAELVPGSSIGLTLAMGDINMFAIGTLTYRDGDRIVVFGHPFASSGPTEIPLVPAVVQVVVPKQDSSFKLGVQAGKPVGVMTQDRPTGVGGYLGRQAKMADVRVSVTAGLPPLARSAEYSFSIIRDKKWFIGLLASGAVQAVSEVLPMDGDWMVQLKADAYFGEDEPLRFENLYYTSGFSALPVLGLLSNLTFFQENPFKEVLFDRVDIHVEALPGNRTAYIDSAALGRPEYAPGEDVDVRVTLVPFEAKPFTTDISFPLPGDATPGSWVTVNICDSRASQQIEASRGPGRFRVQDFGHLVELIQKDEQNTDLFVRALTPRQGLTLEGEAFPSLPSSVLPIIGAPGRPGVQRMQSEIVTSQRTSYYLTGDLTLRVKVSDKGLNK